MTDDKEKLTVDAVRALCDAIIEAAEAYGPAGIPSGHLYAAFQTYGVSLANYERWVAVLVDAGRIVKRGQLLIASTEVRR